jgi:hypothetical protein
MAWAGATRQTAITMSRFVRGIFSAKGRGHRREDAEWVSRKGTLGWFWQCFRVVTHYCHAITLATQGQRGCSILLKEAQSSLMPNRCRVCPQTLSKTEQLWPDTKGLDIVTWMHYRDGNRVRLGSPQSLPCGAAWASKFLNLQPQHRPLRRIFFEWPRVLTRPYSPLRSLGTTPQKLLRKSVGSTDRRCDSGHNFKKPRFGGMGANEHNKSTGGPGQNQTGHYFPT